MSNYAGKRALSRVALVVALLGATLLVGCVVENDNDADPVLENWQVEEQPATSGDATAEESGDATADEASSTSSADDAVIQAGCSYLAYCNAGGPYGTICRQDGCSFADAVSECEAEVYLACGTPVCPWIFSDLNNVKWYLPC